MMNTKLKKLIVTLALLIIFLSFTDANIKITFSSDTGGKIDLFTQKEPYGGKGLNVSSDAFGPEEEVQVFALATYNEYPTPNLRVSFNISGPENPVKNITFFRSALTNETGMATISFRIQSQEEITFGEWTIIGTTRIANLTLHDSVKFKVGWIVEIILINTINESCEEQMNFTRCSNVGVQLGLKNIAMTDKTATLTITIYDSLNTPINSTEINDFVIQPNETLVYAYSFLYIPKNASLGYATVYAGALMTSIGVTNVPYCPEVSTQFLIINRDVAVLDVQPCPTSVYKGEIVRINVTVSNKGSEIESFNVSVYNNETLIEMMAVFNLPPCSNTTIIFDWNTSSAVEGLYQISAFADPVPGEIYLFDNDFVDDFVEIKAKPLIFHDVAVLNTTLSSDTVYVGEILDIKVTVKNEGSFTESFGVIFYYDSYIAGAIFVKSLMPNCIKTLDFHWNTEGVTEGNYTITAKASAVLGELNIDNNEFIDGVVWIKPRMFPKPLETPEWFLALSFLLAVFILACLMAAILIVLLWRRKREEEDEVNMQPTSHETKNCREIVFKQSKTCNTCGKEFPGAYTFCPYCLTFQGKDYE